MAGKLQSVGTQMFSLIVDSADSRVCGQQNGYKSELSKNDQPLSRLKIQRMAFSVQVTFECER